MAAPELLVVDVGGENVKIGGTLTILAITTTLEDARAKAIDLQPRTPFVAVVERKVFFRRKPKIELEEITSPLLKPEAKEEPK